MITEVERLSQKTTQVQDSLMYVKRVVLEKKETDTCSLESNEERLKTINTNL